MDRRLVTPEHRIRLLDALRINPGGKHADFVAAARIAGVDWRTAKRAWERGWDGFGPVRDQVAEVQVRARAEMATEVLRAKAAAAPALAQEDAVLSAAREAMLARGAREVALAFLVEIGPVREYVHALAARVKAGNVDGLSAGEALSQMKDAATVVGKVVDLGQRAVAMERLRLGEPGTIVGLKPMPMETPTLAAVESEAAAVQRALARLKAAGSADDIH